MESDTCDLSEGMSTERAYEAEPVPSLSETITARSLAVSFVLGVTLTVVAMKISLNSGFLPSLSIPACLLGFYLSRVLIRLLEYMDVSHLPFTRQENTVIQTCVAACTTIAFSGGFGTFLLAMGRKSAGDDHVKYDVNVEEPSIPRMIAFLYLVSFAGIFIIMPFRKVMIIRHQLTFPSGTATAHLINSFNTPQGATQAKLQVSMLFKSLAGSLAWSVFQWFFSAGKDCGFKTFPTFGMEAYRQGFFFDFGMTNVGIGMICPYAITLSMLVGSAVSWGFLWPYIETKEGDWYPADLGSGSLSGIKGYKVFIGVSMILADGLFNFLSIMFRTSRTMTKRRKQPMSSAGGNVNQPFQHLIGEGPDMEQQKTAKSFDERRRAQVFLRDSIPNMVTIGVYILLAALSTTAVPILYRQLHYYHVALVYLMAPLFAFCNVYGFGLTDMNLSSTYAKIAMLLFGSWVGLKDGGVVAGLVACGIMMCTLSNGGDVMQDLKTGYLTLTSPRAVLISELIGTAFGCLINPTVFWVFYKVYKTGGANGGDIPDVPYARVYRGMAMLSVGQEGLPRHSMLLAKIFFMLALALCMLRELASRWEWRVQAYLPSTVAMAVAFFVPPDMAIGMCVGSLVLWLWERTDPVEERMLSSPVASGLICGDGLGSLVSSLLTLTKATAPICIKFLSRGDNEKLDAFLAKMPAT
ncbi:probable metal-nicotianamine transporter YSL7 [Triticum dicoccoides]|uniref:Metal-nicotianamine transporter YSL7 n=1 Tax=Triticum turgidum subsp. durum TaxID=4567 RepID=A0A9R0XS19_TRITD|nr:probable metal-nicotianamine transporter YSL7 [Triticum dicoccoides]VAI42002.1 unnamed protein product [Triticum turgidum subsp. durum]